MRELAHTYTHTRAHTHTRTHSHTHTHTHTLSLSLSLFLTLLCARTQRDRERGRMFSPLPEPMDTQESVKQSHIFHLTRNTGHLNVLNTFPVPECALRVCGAIAAVWCHLAGLSLSSLSVAAISKCKPVCLNRVYSRQQGFSFSLSNVGWFLCSRLAISRKGLYFFAERKVRGGSERGVNLQPGRFTTHLHVRLISSHLGFVHPLQDVALHQCLPSSSVCCFPNPGGSLLLCYVILPSSAWSYSRPLPSPWLPLCVSLCPPIVL